MKFYRHAAGLLGCEPSLMFLSKAARLFPSSALLRRLCWHAGENAWDKCKVRQVSIAEYIICCDLSDHTFRGLFFYGEYEPEVTAIIGRLAAPGQVWWDIGANIGWFSMLLSRLVGPEGSVVAFEPNPVTAGYFQIARELNHTLNIHLERRALDEQCGIASLWVPKTPGHVLGGHGRPALLQHEDLEGHLEEITVETVTADALVAAGVEVPYGMKMDVEGFEGAVLKGSARLFQNTPPKVVLCEVNHFPRCLLQPTELVTRFVQMGYQPFHAENMQAYDPALPLDGSWSKDFVFLHESAVEELLPKLQTARGSV